MSVLAALHSAGALHETDHALALLLARLDPATPDAVLAGAALAACAVRHGHAALDPARPELLLEAPMPWPSTEAWIEALQASRWVDAAPEAAASDPQRPLVLERGLLYLRRYRDYEQRLGGRIACIARTPEPEPLDDIAPLFATLFPDARKDDPQARAAALSLLQPLLLLTGGPGTGKTRTVARLLLLHVARAMLRGQPPPRIALAAPTGRAADRLGSSVQGSLAQLQGQAGIREDWGEALPTAAQTLHGLLGSVPGRPQFRHDADHRLPHDIVVVDEASMVDLPLMCKLLEAIRDDARVILIGDRDQLPSVEAGDVLAVIGDAAGDGTALPPVLAEALRPLLGETPCAENPSHPLAGHRVQLLRSYRQSAALQLAPLADAVRRGDAEAALQALHEGVPGLAWQAEAHDLLAADRQDALLQPWRELAACSEPAEALALIDRQRVLTALREGPHGAAGLNARIEEALAGPDRAPYFHGRLLLVTRNSPRIGLSNGDVGVCLREGEGDVLAWFAGPQGPRGFPPLALPLHASAFATTVHKAQGSEFDRVALVLPPQDARVLSRELLYTGLTRAREGIALHAGEQVLRLAIGRSQPRVSGLAARLAAARC